MQDTTAHQKIQKEQSGWLFHEAQGGMGVKKVEAIFTPKEERMPYSENPAPITLRNIFRKSFQALRRL